MLLRCLAAGNDVFVSSSQLILRSHQQDKVLVVFRFYITSKNALLNTTLPVTLIYCSLLLLLKIPGEEIFSPGYFYLVFLSILSAAARQEGTPLSCAVMVRLPPLYSVRCCDALISHHQHAVGSIDRLCAIKTLQWIKSGPMTIGDVH